MDLLGQRPGLTASELCRAVGMKWGAVQHHLYLLEKGRVVASATSGRNRGFFPTGIDVALSRQIVVVRTGRTKEVAMTVARHPGIRQSELTRAIRISRKVFRNCLKALLGEGLIEEGRAEGRCAYHPTLRLLAVVQAAGLVPMPAAQIPTAAPADAVAAATATGADPIRLETALTVPRPSRAAFRPQGRRV